MADQVMYVILDEGGQEIASAIGRVNAKFALETLLEEGAHPRLTAVGYLMEKELHRVEAHRLDVGTDDPGVLGVEYRYPQGLPW